MSVNAISNRPAPGVDPNTYAQQYATKNGISLEEAKAELKAKFGDPQKPVSIFQQKPDASVDPDTYLSQSGSTKAELIAKYGAPTKPSSVDQNSSILNLLKQLISLLKGDNFETSDSEEAPSQGTTGKDGEKYLDGLVAKALDIEPKAGLAKDNEIKNEADVAKLNTKATETKVTETKSAEIKATTSTKDNETYKNAASTLGYTLTGDATTDKATIQERVDSLYRAASSMNPSNYKAIMPYLAATLSVPYSGNAVYDCQVVAQKAQHLKTSWETNKNI